MIESASELGPKKRVERLNSTFSSRLSLWLNNRWHLAGSQRGGGGKKNANELVFIEKEKKNNNNDGYVLMMRWILHK